MIRGRFLQTKSSFRIVSIFRSAKAAIVRDGFAVAQEPGNKEPSMT